MKLADYLFRHGLIPQDLQKELGLTRSTVHRYLIGERIPRPTTMVRVTEFTSGQVQLVDFLDERPPECAAVRVLPNGRVRIILPWTNRDSQLEVAHALMMRESPEDRQPTWHEQRALHVLGPHAKRGENWTYTLNGKPTDLRRLIEAANRILVKRGSKPIKYPKAWPNDQ